MLQNNLFPLNFVIFFSLSLSYFKVADGVAESHPLLGNVEDHGLLVVGVSHKVDAPQPGVQ